MDQTLSLLQAAIVFGTVILFGATGEILTEKSGNLNLGVPGIMYLGGIAGLAGAFMYESGVASPIPGVGLAIALVCALGVSILAGLIYSFLTITLRANQQVTGLTLTIFGAGVAPHADLIIIACAHPVMDTSVLFMPRIFSALL